MRFMRITSCHHLPFFRTVTDEPRFSYYSFIKRKELEILNWKYINHKFPNIQIKVLLVLVVEKVLCEALRNYSMYMLKESKLAKKPYTSLATNEWQRLNRKYSGKNQNYGYKKEMTSTPEHHYYCIP